MRVDAMVDAAANLPYSFSGGAGRGHHPSIEEPFDFVFIDADKTGDLGYYEAVLPKLAPRG